MPKMPLEAPTRLEEAPRGAQEPLEAPKRPKIPLEAPKRLDEALIGAHDGPRGAQEAQDPPRCAQKAR